MSDEGSKFVFKRLQLTPKSIREAHTIEDKLRLQKVADLAADRRLRGWFAVGIFALLVGELFAVFYLAWTFIKSGKDMSEATIGLLVAATLTQTWAILQIVAQYLFPNRDGKESDAQPPAK